MFLLVSELSIFRGFFARNWPLLSPTHGFVTLAMAMLVLGINMLGNLNKEATSQESLGLAFWRIVIASGIIIFILGWLNLIAVSLPKLRLRPPSDRLPELHLPRSQQRRHCPSSPRTRCSRRPQNSHAFKHPQLTVRSRAGAALHQPPSDAD